MEVDKSLPQADLAIFALGETGFLARCLTPVYYRKLHARIPTEEAGFAFVCLFVCDEDLREVNFPPRLPRKGFHICTTLGDSQ